MQHLAEVTIVRTLFLVLAVIWNLLDFENIALFLRNEVSMEVWSDAFEVCREGGSNTMEKEQSESRPIYVNVDSLYVNVDSLSHL